MYCVLDVKALVDAFNYQEKSLVGAFYIIVKTSQKVRCELYYKHQTYQHSMLPNTGAKLETWSWAWPCSAPRDLLKQFYINFVLIAGHKFYDITRIIFSRAPFVSLGNLQTDPLTQNLLDILSSPLLPMLGRRKVLNVWASKYPECAGL